MFSKTECIFEYLINMNFKIFLFMNFRIFKNMKIAQKDRPDYEYFCSKH